MSIEEILFDAGKLSALCGILIQCVRLVQRQEHQEKRISVLEKKSDEQECVKYETRAIARGFENISEIQKEHDRRILSLEQDKRR